MQSNSQACSTGVSRKLLQATRQAFESGAEAAWRLSMQLGSPPSIPRFLVGRVSLPKRLQ
jgi:hypothetical protein